MGQRKKPAAEGAAATQFKRGRRPHNAKTLEFENVADLVRKLGAEKKRVMRNGEEEEMTWAERSLRLTVERAVNGNVRDIAQLLRLMLQYPHISGPGRLKHVVFVRGALAEI